jgi:hypothetical protein
MAEVEAEVEAGAEAGARARVGVKVAAQATADHLDDGARARSDHRRQTAQVIAGPGLLGLQERLRDLYPGESKVEKEEAAFPNLMLVLQGQGVKIDLTGGIVCE